MPEREIIEISDDSDYKSSMARNRSFYEDDDDFVVIEEPRLSSSTPALPPSSLPPSSQEKVYDISDLEDDENGLPDVADILREVSSRRYRATPSSSPESLKRKNSTNGYSGRVDTSEKPKPKRRRKTTEDKALEQAAKEIEKAKKKRETQQKKGEAAARKAEEKAAQKTSRAVNKLVVDKKTTLKDMIVEISPLLVNSPLYLPLKQKLAEYDCRIQPITSSGNSVELIDVKRLQNLGINIVRWKRHVKATYDEKQRKWLPLPDNQHHLRPEGTYLIYVTGDDLVNILSKNPTVPSLEAQVSALRRVVGPRYHIHLMICGWKGKTNIVKILDVVQEQLVILQIKESLFIEEVAHIEDAVTWIYNITADLGIKPYQLIERSHLPFCPESGNIKVGQSDSDTFKKMLTQLPRLSEKGASAIVKEFGTINKLMEAYEKAELTGGGPGLLAKVKIPGSGRDRDLNNALSARLYHLLWGSDPKVLIN